MIRLALRTLAIVLAVLVCVPLHYGSKLLLGRSRWPRRFLGFVGRAAGMRAKVRGEPLAGHVLFVANHKSWLDIMLLAGASGTAFVSRDDVARWPVIGWLSSLNDTVFVDRSERRSIPGQADALRAALAAGRPVALFPEGTTGGGAELLPFRPSLLASLFPPPPGVRVQPVAIDYGAHGAEIAWSGDEGAAANAKRILSRAGTVPVLLTFCAPLDPAAFADRKALAAAARAEIEAALGRKALSHGERVG